MERMDCINSNLSYHNNSATHDSPRLGYSSLYCYSNEGVIR